jgi:hypothetical protein
VQIAGAHWHQELWVPAGELDEFNRHIIGGITITDAYRGDACVVELDQERLVPASWLIPPPDYED